MFMFLNKEEKKKPSMREDTEHSDENSEEENIPE